MFIEWELPTLPETMIRECIGLATLNPPNHLLPFGTCLCLGVDIVDTLCSGVACCTVVDAAAVVGASVSPGAAVRSSL